MIAALGRARGAAGIAVEKAAGDASGAGYRRWVLTVLVIVYGFNFIDRQIIGMLAVPIKRDLNLSDGQLGLMGGLAFALLYTLLAVPVARYADRGRRVRVLGASLALWSLMTALCGSALSFTQLFLGRVGVGVGEAGGVAPAHSLISDYFPAGERARALGIYALAVPLGSALGIVAGGYLASVADWRFAFRVVGIAGLLFAPVVGWSLREPVARATPAATVGLREAVGLLVGNVSFVALALGAGIGSIAGYGVLFWLPSFYVRTFGLTLWHASLGFAAVLAVGGVVGIVLGGRLGDRLGAAAPGRYALVAAAGFAGAAPLFALALLAPNATLSLALLVLPLAFALGWLGPAYAAVQRLAGEGLRATAAAVFLFVVNLIGLGVGAPLIGLLSDRFAPLAGTAALRNALLVALLTYPVGALFFAFAATRLGADSRRVAEEALRRARPHAPAGAGPRP
jgi:MFS family permease